MPSFSTIVAGPKGERACRRQLAEQGEELRSSGQGQHPAVGRRPAWWIPLIPRGGDRRAPPWSLVDSTRRGSTCAGTQRGGRWTVGTVDGSAVWQYVFTTAEGPPRHRRQQLSAAGWRPQRRAAAVG